MIDPVTGMLVAKGALGLVQTIAGATKEVKRPRMTVPQGVIDAAKAYKMRANATSAPGSATAKADIGTNFANQMASFQKILKDPSTTMGALYKMNQQKQNALGQVNQRDLAYRDNAANQYASQNNLLGQYQQKAWEWNEKQKFEEDAAAKSALIGGGINNMANAASDYASASLMREGMVSGAPAPARPASYFGASSSAQISKFKNNAMSWKSAYNGKLYGY